MSSMRASAPPALNRVVGQVYQQQTTSPSPLNADQKPINHSHFTSSSGLGMATHVAMPYPHSQQNQYDPQYSSQPVSGQQGVYGSGNSTHYYGQIPDPNADLYAQNSSYPRHTDTSQYPANMTGNFSNIPAFPPVQPPTTSGIGMGGQVIFGHTHSREMGNSGEDLLYDDAAPLTLWSFRKPAGGKEVEDKKRKVMLQVMFMTDPTKEQMGWIDTPVKSSTHMPTPAVTLGYADVLEEHIEIERDESGASVRLRIAQFHLFDYIMVAARKVLDDCFKENPRIGTQSGELIFAKAKNHPLMIDSLCSVQPSSTYR